MTSGFPSISAYRKPVSTVTRQYLWQRKMNAQGRCNTCGQPANANGIKCDPCAVKAKLRAKPDPEYQRAYRAKHRDAIRNYLKAWRAAHPDYAKKGTSK